MRRELGHRMVGPPCDVVLGPEHDLTDKMAFQFRKKRGKSRDVWLTHYSPPCTTFTYAQRHFQQRSMTEPEGIALKRPFRSGTDEQTTLAERALRLCALHHDVGDAFSLEHPYPSPLIELQAAKDLLGCRGVFFITWDNCMYGETYRHRQMLITNFPPFARLSRDCDMATRPHEHTPIGFSRPLATSDVATFADGFCKEYARLVKRFVKARTMDNDLCYLCLQG